MANVSKVRFRDLSLDESERHEILGELDLLMQRGQFILGEQVEQLVFRMGPEPYIWR